MVPTNAPVFLETHTNFLSVHQNSLGALLLGENTVDVTARIPYEVQYGVSNARLLALM